MHIKWLFLIMALLGATACNLATHGATGAMGPDMQVEEAREFASSLMPTPIPTIMIIVPTVQPTIQPPARPIPCHPYSDWPLYTVVARDTLTGIAKRTNSNVSELVAANCLTDPNLIVTGTELHVPVLPVESTLHGQTTMVMSVAMR
jgi:hypothetical protein